MSDCGCSYEYGPCEKHSTTIFHYEGVRAYTTDENMLVLIEDLLTLFPKDIPSRLKQRAERLVVALEAGKNPITGTARFPDSDDFDDAVDLITALEAEAHISVIQNDGDYRVISIHPDCPLLTGKD